MTPRNFITVTIFEKEQYDSNDWPPESATEFMAWFAAKLATIPRKFAASASVKLDSRCGYEDSSYASICITYLRPETDDEMEYRNNADTRRKLLVIQNERASSRS
jgi:hypothetical protein